MKENRLSGFLVVGVTYIFAIVAGVFIFHLFPQYNVFLRVLLGDLGGTIVVWLVGVLFGNASCYDPYWSLQPLVILGGLAFYYQMGSASTLLLLFVIFLWGIRLTINWGHTFKNLNTQDWRYDNLKIRFPRLFPLINLGGIHLFPTLVVYLALLPGMVILEVGKAVDVLSVIGCFVSLMGVGLQFFADRQMHQFRKNRQGDKELIRVGLWKYSRHPNYLGEILMWWGVYIMMLGVAPERWYLGIGALVNTMMFLVVSIPMADRRNRSKVGFSQYVKETRSLWPLKKK